MAKTGKAYPEAEKIFSEGPEFTPGDEGCYVQGHNSHAVLKFAQSHGFKMSFVKPNTDLAVAATEWLNKFAPTGFYFGVNESNAAWGLWRNDEAWGDLEREFMGEFVGPQ